MSSACGKAVQRNLYIETYGCQMNEADTELICGHLAQHGYHRVEDIASADVILVNTCAVRKHAEERVLGRLSYFATLKRKRPDLVVGVLGCMAQHLQGQLLELTTPVDLIAGPDTYRRLPQLLQEARDRPRSLDVTLNRCELYADIHPLRSETTRAWIPIMRGCDKFCAFCIVPLVRGRERCAPAKQILDEVKRCADAGCKEVVFLGQTVNSYRDGAIGFAELLCWANAIAGIQRIRFTSPHPADMDEDIVQAMSECKKVMPHIHLPLQSASNRVLAHMRRKHTIEQYDDLVQRLRRKVSDLALTTDILVGFHDETEEDFLATYDYVTRTRFDAAFMFKYSPREGTRAYAWGDTVPEEEKHRRLQAIINLQERIAAEKNQEWVGRSVEVLVEGVSRKAEDEVRGKSPQYKTVVFPADNVQPGAVVDVQVTSATSHTLTGVLKGGEKNCVQTQSRKALKGRHTEVCCEQPL